VAIGAKHADIVGSIILPISVDVLDLERHPASKRIAFIPTATLAFIAGCFDDVASDRAVEVKARRQCSGLPECNHAVVVVFELAALRTKSCALRFDSSSATVRAKRAYFC
jgi:hypothetical protein